MTFKEYVKAANKFLEDNPHFAELECVYSIDDEGNDFKRVVYSPDEYKHEDFGLTVCVN